VGRGDDDKLGGVEGSGDELMRILVASPLAPASSSSAQEALRRLGERVELDVFGTGRQRVAARHEQAGRTGTGAHERRCA